MDADYLATGHYARVEARDGRVDLLRAVDDGKDQSYVLFTLQQRELERLLFPVGGYPKTEIRRLAQEMALPLYDKPDSAEICFVPDGDYRSFISQRLPQTPGAIVDQDGAEVGQHEGVAGFTIGQRKGIGAFGSKRFVTSIDPEANLVTIGDEEDLLSRRLWAEKISWTAETPAAEFRATVKVRYKSPAVAATVRVLGDGIEVEFDRPLRAITPGQAAVVYDGDRVIGGGIIARTERRLAASAATAATLPIDQV